jgi:hypothetical protein
MAFQAATPVDGDPCFSWRGQVRHLEAVERASITPTRTKDQTDISTITI